MPTSKIVYIRSNACEKTHPNNSWDRFTFHLKQPIKLVTPNQVLSIALKGILCPITSKDISPDVKYIKIHLKILEHQRSQILEQCLIRIPVTEKVKYIQIPHNRHITLNTYSIQDFSFQITDEKDGKISTSNNWVGGDTLIKLEISSMSASQKTFIVTCSSNKLKERYDQNEPCVFRSWLPSEIDFEKKQYRVGLTTAIFPLPLLKGEKPPTLTLLFGLRRQEKQIQFKIYPKLEKVKTSKVFIDVVNLIFEKEKMPVKFMFTKSRSMVGIFFTLMVDLSFLNKDNGKKLPGVIEDYVTVEKTVIFGPHRGANLPKITQKFNKNANKICCLTLDINESLSCLFNGNRRAVGYTLNVNPKFSSQYGKFILRNSDTEFDQNLKNILVEDGICVYSPLVTNTYSGLTQDHLLEIIPLHNSDKGVLLYHPSEVTYHDAIHKNNLTEIFFKITDLNGNPVCSFGDKEITIVLHFKPFE